MPARSHHKYSDKYSGLKETPPVYQGSLIDSGPVNATLIEQHQQAVASGNCRQTHFFNGRFENTYIDIENIPSLQSVTDMVKFYAGQILAEDIETLKFGFWFNAMQPGNNTSLHTHEEYEEKLSAVYYISAPPDSGDLLIHNQIHSKDKIIRITPVAGQIVMFRPEVPHEVATNQSRELRLSVAFNFGL